MGGCGVKSLRPGRGDVTAAAGPQRAFDVAGGAAGTGAMLQHVAAQDKVERIGTQPRLQRARVAADIEHEVDIRAVEQIDADELCPAGEAPGDQRAPVAFVAVRQMDARPDLQYPWIALTH